jgi:hypothetical protein
VRPSPTSAKRWTIKVALCLLTGAVVTWGVAWGCAVWGDLGMRGLPLAGTGFSWQTEVPTDWPPPSFATQSDAFGKDQEVRGGRGPLGQSVRALVTDTGWPGRSMRHTFVYDEYRLIRNDGIDIPSRDTSLPTRILPVGFALNTLYYATVLLGVVEGVAFARRVRRGKGRCPACGYDRAGLAEGAGCPECGRGAAG